MSQQPQIHSKDERNDGGLRVYCARLQIRIGGRVKEDACVCDWEFEVCGRKEKISGGDHLPLYQRNRSQPELLGLQLCLWPNRIRVRNKHDCRWNIGILQLCQPQLNFCYLDLVIEKIPRKKTLLVFYSLMAGIGFLFFIQDIQDSKIGSIVVLGVIRYIGSITLAIQPCPIPSSSSCLQKASPPMFSRSALASSNPSDSWDPSWGPSWSLSASTWRSIPSLCSLSSSSQL